MSAGNPAAKGADESLPEWGVIVRAWQRDKPPGNPDFEEFVVHAEDEDAAKDKAIERAKNDISRSIIGSSTGGYGIEEVVRYDD